MVLEKRDSTSELDCLVGLDCLLSIVKALGMGSCLSGEGAGSQWRLLVELWSFNHGSSDGGLC